jgi:DNA polymerase elongation subunit (family B)
MKAKTLTFDIETSMNLGGYFGRSYDVQIAKVIQKGFVFGFAYKWLDKPKIYSCYIWDFPLYKKEPKNDINVVKKWAELMQDTNVVVGWNSDKFDNRVMYGRLLIHKLPPLAMPQSFDVMKAVKKLAAYDSYKLNDVSESFGHGSKIETNIELWWDCLMGIKKAQRMMVDLQQA